MLELYQMEHCPFCAKVRQVMEELDLDFVSRNMSKGSQKRELLRRLGGKEQVPFLVDTSDQNHVVMLYESNDIINYLRKQYGT